MTVVFDSFAAAPPQPTSRAHRRVSNAQRTEQSPSSTDSLLQGVDTYHLSFVRVSGPTFRSAVRKMGRKRSRCVFAIALESHALNFGDSSSSSSGSDSSSASKEKDDTKRSQKDASESPRCAAMFLLSHVVKRRRSSSPRRRDGSRDRNRGRGDSPQRSPERRDEAKESRSVHTHAYSRGASPIDCLSQA